MTEKLHIWADIFPSIFTGSFSNFPEYFSRIYFLGFGLDIVQRRLSKIVQNRISIGIRQIDFSRLSREYCVFFTKISTTYIQKEQIASPKNDHVIRKPAGHISYVRALALYYRKADQPNLNKIESALESVKRFFSRFSREYCAFYVNFNTLYTEITNRRSKKRQSYWDLLLFLFLQKSFEPYIVVKKIK
jgi:hypothetical protein